MINTFIIIVHFDICAERVSSWDDTAACAQRLDELPIVEIAIGRITSNGGGWAKNLNQKKIALLLTGRLNSYNATERHIVSVGGVADDGIIYCIMCDECVLLRLVIRKR